MTNILRNHAVWRDKLNEYISAAKAFGENKILAALKVIGEIKYIGIRLYFSLRVC